MPYRPRVARRPRLPCRRSTQQRPTPVQRRLRGIHRWRHNYASTLRGRPCKDGSAGILRHRQPRQIQRKSHGTDARRRCGTSALVLAGHQSPNECVIPALARAAHCRISQKQTPLRTQLQYGSLAYGPVRSQRIRRRHPRIRIRRHGHHRTPQQPRSQEEICQIPRRRISSAPPDRKNLSKPTNRFSATTSPLQPAATASATSTMSNKAQSV